MNPTFELTKTGTHAAWEGGSFFTEKARGSAVLFAHPNFSKPDALYDRVGTYDKYGHHALVRVDVGSFVGSAVVVQNPALNVFSVTLTLKVVEELREEAPTPTSRQKHKPQLVASLRQVYSTKFLSYPNDLRLKDGLKDLIAIISSDYIDDAEDFLEACLMKAITPPQAQHTFWCNPLKPRTDTAKVSTPENPANQLLVSSSESARSESGGNFLSVDSQRVDNESYGNEDGASSSSKTDRTQEDSLSDSPDSGTSDTRSSSTTVEATYTSISE